MQFDEFKNKLEDKIEQDINSSYFKNYKWDTTRCRIDICFWSELILDVITRKFNKYTMNDINEEYLRKTRDISKNEYNYKNSNNMDINAICKWLNIDKQFELKNKNQLSIETYFLYINKYIDEKFKLRKYDDKFSKEWNEYIQNNNDILDLNTNHIYIKNIISDTCLNKKWKLISNDEWKPHVIKENKIMINSKINNKGINDLEIIGKDGEQIAYEYLKSKYCPIGWKVNWSSQVNPYGPYDFEIVKDNEKIYIEVKSTVSKTMSHFFISINEYYFYRKNSNNYNLILLSNIYECREGKSPSIQEFNNVNIIISDKSGIEKNHNQWFFYTTINQLKCEK